MSTHREDQKHQEGYVPAIEDRVIDYDDGMANFTPSRPKVAIASREWPTLIAFAEVMARKLQEHRDKGPDGVWTASPWNTPDILLDRVREELIEARLRHLNAWTTNHRTSDELEQAVSEFVEECADIANMAMMAADCMTSQRLGERLLDFVRRGQK